MKNEKIFSKEFLKNHVLEIAIAIFIALSGSYSICAVVAYFLFIICWVRYDKKIKALETIHNSEEEAKNYYAQTKEKADKEINDLKLEAEIYCIQQKKKVDEEINDFKSNMELQYNQEKKETIEKIDSLKIQQKELEKEIQLLQKNIFAEYASIDIDDTVSSEEYKNKLSILRLKEKEFIKSKKALVIASKDSAKILNNNIKQILRCFQSESAIIVSSVTAKNIDTARNKLQRSFEILNNIFSTDGVALSYDLLSMKMEELNLIYSYQQKIEQEKEEQKVIREQLLEEQKVLKEIEKEKAKLEKEEKQFKNEISKLMAYMQKSSDIEKQLYIDKIKELESKLQFLEKDKKNVLQREQNTHAGFVYIISNIGSFGENIYKIGMTRRLEPMNRIKELSNASVPFEFDVHAMIFSEDAPKLEKILHQTFEQYRVNKINTRKEFFHVDITQIEKVVKENHNSTVAFKLFADAEQYRQGLCIASNKPVLQETKSEYHVDLIRHTPHKKRTAPNKHIQK